MLRGILGRAHGRRELVVCAKMEEWSEIVVELEDPADTRALDAAKRLCGTNKRELLPRVPHWPYQDNEVFKKGGQTGT